MRDFAVAVRVPVLFLCFWWWDSWKICGNGFVLFLLGFWNWNWIFFIGFFCWVFNWGHFLGVGESVFFFFFEMFGWWVSLGFGIVLWSFDFRFEVFVVTFSYRDEWIENFENGKNLIEFSFFPAFVAKKN